MTRHVRDREFPTNATRAACAAPRSTSARSRKRLRARRARGASRAAARTVVSWFTKHKTSQRSPREAPRCARAQRDEMRRVASRQCLASRVATARRAEPRPFPLKHRRTMCARRRDDRRMFEPLSSPHNGRARRRAGRPVCVWPSLIAEQRACRAAATAGVWFDQVCLVCLVCLSRYQPGQYSFPVKGLPEVSGRTCRIRIGALNNWKVTVICAAACAEAFIGF